MNLTWRELKKHLDSMPDIQLDGNLSIFDPNDGEFFGIKRIEEAPYDDVLDAGHPFMVMDKN